MRDLLSANDALLTGMIGGFLAITVLSQAAPGKPTTNSRCFTCSTSRIVSDPTTRCGMSNAGPTASSRGCLRCSPRPTATPVEIQLYDKLDNHDVRCVEDALIEALKYLDPKKILTLNGKRVNDNLTETKWTHETPEAYVLLNNSAGLKVYNLGVHTMDLGAYKYGSGGVVVSRKQLKVNFARNDLMGDCPVWTAIKPLIVKESLNEIRKSKKKLTDDQRRWVLRELARDGEVEGLYEIPVFLTLHGRPMTLKRMVSEIRRCNMKITFCEEGDPIADRICQQGLSYPMAEDAVRAVVRERHLECRRCRERQGDDQHRDEERIAQHHLRPRRQAGVHGGVEVPLSVRRRDRHEQGRR
jgi:hypothetical protein